MLNDENEDRGYEQQVKRFENLVDRVDALLKQYGKHDSLEPGDYSIYGDYWGFRQVKVSANNLKMLRPAIIEGLQQIVKEYPGWEIVVAVAVRGHFGDWPQMGLYVRPQEIVDGLQRQYFPKEFQSLKYPGARPGTVND